MPDLFKDWIPSLNEKTGNLFRESGNDLNSISDEYPLFMVNRAFSQMQETIIAANAVNVRAQFMSPQMQYDFLYYAIPKKKRFSKWAKPEKSEAIELIKKTYNYSQKKAEEVLALFGESDIERLKEYNFEGGK